MVIMTGPGGLCKWHSLTRSTMTEKHLDQQYTCVDTGLFWTAVSWKIASAWCFCLAEQRCGDTLCMRELWLYLVHCLCALGGKEGFTLCTFIIKHKDRNVKWLLPSASMSVMESNIKLQINYVWANHRKYDRKPLSSPGCQPLHHKHPLYTVHYLFTVKLNQYFC